MMPWSLKFYVGLLCVFVVQGFIIGSSNCQCFDCWRIQQANNLVASVAEMAMDNLGKPQEGVFLGADNFGNEAMASWVQESLKTYLITYNIRALGGMIQRQPCYFSIQINSTGRDNMKQFHITAFPKESHAINSYKLYKRSYKNSAVKRTLQQTDTSEVVQPKKKIKMDTENITHEGSGDNSR